MVIKKEKNDTKVTLTMEGRIDTKTSSSANAIVQEAVGEASELVLDLKGVEYMSSAGLRVLLSAQKAMNKKGGMTLKNVPDVVMEVLEITGMIDIMNIE